MIKKVHVTERLSHVPAATADSAFDNFETDDALMIVTQLLFSTQLLFYFGSKTQGRREEEYTCTCINRRRSF